MRHFPILLSLLLAAPTFADEADETAIKAAGLPTDGPVLLDFVKQRSRETAGKDELAPFIKDLASPDPKTAEKAATALVVRGPLAVPALRRAANDLADKTLAERARKALGHIEGRAGADLAAAVTRLLGAKKPTGSVEALLALSALRRRFGRVGRDRDGPRATGLCRRQGSFGTSQRRRE